ncbi:hypothetical protein TNCV_209711 [Trichonephila clavipes]|uniref:Uncharacterized protein n=1 Tax=Trichonephila clavipes TaxID=2585209 RepID=A0A8X6SUM5_TRICX|nr:hypothetical protein TNCV_209711 [Trichonephila clavipes]
MRHVRQYIKYHRGSRVVKVSGRGLPCHEFQPKTTKEPPCRTAMLVKLESSNVLPLVWWGIQERGGASSGVIHIT